jgi:DNA repair protein SbcC/Rad50
MKISRLTLRNFRVFPEVDLELPPGVVGIYGPNGAGKSTLVEAILWALFGVARTAKDAVRSDGSTGECRAEVGFEHDGHHYEILRVLSGANHTVRAEASCDGERVAAGAVAVRQYVHHVLGMSAESFRASVFCEQKQLDAFSGRRPEDRRRLVLDLLGITPLDRARESARARARLAGERVEAARQLFCGLDALAAEAGALEGELAAAAQARARAEEVLAEAEAEAVRADTGAGAVEAVKAERDRLAASWKEAARRREEARHRLHGRRQELAALEEARQRLPAAQALADRLEPLRVRQHGLAALSAAREVLARAEAAVTAAMDADSPAFPSDQEEQAAAAARAAGEAAGRLAGAETARAAAEERRRVAATEAGSAGRLDPGAPCPLCGQSLGRSFAEVQEHRARALAEAESALAGARAEAQAAQAALSAAEARATEADRRLQRARAAEARRGELQAAVAAARRSVAEVEGALAHPPVPGELDVLRAELATLEAARDEALRLVERLRRSGAVEAAVAEEEAALAEASELAETLAAQGKALRFDSASHAAASEERQQAGRWLEAVRAQLVEARLTERGLVERLAERRTRLEAEQERRHELVAVEDEARHLGRLAELLSDFRNSLLAQVGPTLTAQTSALFRELTDGRFDRLEVDPDTFELRVGAAGRTAGIDRHSGSETDLANLSLRIAIGEQVTLLSGGQVGLLVLDEVMGGLDGEHRDRVLAAIGRLAGRYRQVLVVTHAAEVKEQLPQAIEVESLSRGRSEARLGARLQLLETG